MELSNEELDFFKEVFNEEPLTLGSDANPHEVTVQTSVPHHLKSVLGNAKLTLLAEVSHYQLWFPVTLSMKGVGDFTPELGIPEIIDIQGIDRSWRVSTPEDVSILDAGDYQGVKILSLSSTGLTLQADSPLRARNIFARKEISMRLPNQQKVTLELDPVRTEGGIIAARFKTVGDGRDLLRRYLFNLHRQEYSDLYSTL